MFEENKQLVRRALAEVFAEGNFGVVNEIFHPDFVNHEAGPRTPPGPEGLKVTVGWLRAAFSEPEYEVKDLIAEGDKVAARVISRGRHTGEFLGQPPSGKRFEAQQIHIYRIADGKIVEHWSARDDLTQGMQLGLIPTETRPNAEERRNAGARRARAQARRSASGSAP